MIPSALPGTYYLTFLSVPEFFNHGKATEKQYEAHGHFSQIVMVCRADVEEFTKTGYRIMAMFPGVLGDIDHGFTSDERRKHLKKFAGYPRFTFGQYYDLDCLLLMDDVMEYHNHRRDFDKIRSCRDLVKENKHHKNK